jgi:hypothetical protein
MIDYEHITLEELDTSRFLVDPKLMNFPTRLKKRHKDFAFELEAGLPEGKILRYISLMYDPNSELRNNIPHLPSRKRICARIVGFEMTEKRFDPLIEDMLCGKFKRINKAIVAYCFLTNNIYVVAHAAFQDMYFRSIAESFLSYDKETIKNIQDLQDKLLKNEQMIFGGEEFGKIKEALYAFTTKIENEIIPEKIVQRIEKGDKLEDFSPYPDGYIPEKLQYVGTESPERN